jgi:hypothetical protein
MYWEANKPMHQKVLTLNPFIISPAHRILSRSLFPLQGLYRQSKGFSVLPPLFSTVRYCCLVRVVGKKSCIQRQNENFTFQKLALGQ